MFILDGIGGAGTGRRRGETVPSVDDDTGRTRGETVPNVNTGRACGDALSEGAGDGERDGALPRGGGGGGRRRRSVSEDDGRRSGDPCPDPEPDFYPLGLSSSPVLPESCLLNKLTDVDEEASSSNLDLRFLTACSDSLSTSDGFVISSWWMR
ncbi:hypothetical protein BDQ17DRAFT_1378524 [Cyathus striatus]|nr:hypothetical protein BDQ17DRAFT_1378524 [Cyathus striatus]